MLIAVIGFAVLAGCDQIGQGGGSQDTVLPANAPNQRVQPGQDVERPDLFQVTDRGLWDGRPSLGGVWVAHPDAQTPERVVIRNTLNGQSIIGALFRRERENPGPLLQVSSDAADALGILPGAPTELNVVALRRAEVDAAPSPEVATNPVVASLEAPVSVESAPLDPAEGTAAVAAAGLPPAAEAATTAIAEVPSADAVDASAVLSQPVAPADGPTAQIGIFSVKANADTAVQTIIAAGIEARVSPQEIGGRTVWRVLAGPLVDGTVVGQLQELGYVDAFIVETGE